MFSICIRSKAVYPAVHSLSALKCNFNTEFENAAFKRIDFFHGLSYKEYDFLKTLWPKLPTFLQIDYSFIKPNLSNLKPIPQKGKLVLIGNNKSAYNNHLDIIEIINT